MVNSGGIAAIRLTGEIIELTIRNIHEREKTTRDHGLCGISWEYCDYQ